jgi:hypothetical protein
MPTVLTALPFSFLPVLPARMVFGALGAFAFAYALMKHGYALLPLLLSVSFAYAVHAAQWTPFIAAGFLLPALAWTVPLKPNVGLPVLLATPSRQAVASAGVGVSILLLMSWAIQPTWLSEWRTAIAQAPHIRIPFLALSGPILILALFRWRRFESYLLLAYALTPHTPIVYEVLPLGLIARTRMEAIVFSLLTYLAIGLQMYGLPLIHPEDRGDGAVIVLNLTIYLPCLAIILSRPNEGPVPAIAEMLLPRVRRGSPRIA